MVGNMVKGQSCDWQLGKQKSAVTHMWTAFQSVFLEGRDSAYTRIDTEFAQQMLLQYMQLKHYT